MCLIVSVVQSDNIYIYICVYIYTCESTIGWHIHLTKAYVPHMSNSIYSTIRHVYNYYPIVYTRTEASMPHVSNSVSKLQSDTYITTIG